MPDVCGVFKSSCSECTILTPCSAQSIFRPLVQGLHLCCRDYPGFNPCAAAVPPDLRPHKRDCLPGQTSDGFIMRGHPTLHRRAATLERTTLPSLGRGLMAQTPDVCRDR